MDFSSLRRHQRGAFKAASAGGRKRPWPWQGLPEAAVANLKTPNISRSTRVLENSSVAGMVVYARALGRAG